LTNALQKTKLFLINWSWDIASLKFLWVNDFQSIF